MNRSATLTFLGTRGTAPVEQPATRRYGGGTSCALLRLGGEAIVLDGGTGLMNLAPQLGPEEGFSLLLSHPHFDHMAGIPGCPLLFERQRRIGFYAAAHGGLSARDQLTRLMSPPLWPVEPDSFSAAIDFHTLSGPISLGPVAVKLMEGNHPGGCTVFRLEHEGLSVVYASDYELTEESTPPLAEFSRDCTLLLCDGQYTEEEFATRHGFGHSTWNAAAQLARDCGASALRILHHAPWRRDDELDAFTPLLQAIFTNSAFARHGEELCL